MLRHSIHDKRFVTTGNEHGVSGTETIFHYRMDGAMITARYDGGPIREGHVVGRAVDEDHVELLYHCLTSGDELLAGWSHGVVALDDRGRLTLAFDWAWFTGDQSGEPSRYVELDG